MYEKDKKTRITVRLTNEQFEAVKSKSDVLGISPSDFIRMLINSMIYVEAHGNPIDTQKIGGLSRENDKADSDNLV